MGDQPAKRGFPCGYCCKDIQIHTTDSTSGSDPDVRQTMTPPRHHGKAPEIQRVLGLLASDAGILLVTTLIMVAVYILDTVSPLGEPVWLLYLIPLVLSFWSGRYYAIPTVFAVTVLFLAAGFYLSPQGIPMKIAILNRFTFFLVFFLAALLLWWIRGRQIRKENL